MAGLLTHLARRISAKRDPTIRAAYPTRARRAMRRHSAVSKPSWERPNLLSALSPIRAEVGSRHAR